MITLTTNQLNYQQIVLYARQLPLTERVRLVRDILAEPIEDKEEPETEPQETHSALEIIEAHHRFLEEHPEHRLFQSAEEVDEFIRQERDSWDR